MGHQRQITEKDVLIYSYLIDFKFKHNGATPTYRQIMNECLISSTSVVAYCLEKLENAGYIYREENGYIGIEGDKWSLQSVRIPKLGELLPEREEIWE